MGKVRDYIWWTELVFAQRQKEYCMLLRARRFAGLMAGRLTIKPSNHQTISLTCSNFLIRILPIVLISLLASCEQRDELAVQALIKEQVASNVQVFRNRRIQICYKTAMEEAVYIADSIAIARALASKDTSQFIRPLKPVKPKVIIPKDDTPVAPLFKEGEKERGKD